MDEKGKTTSNWKRTLYLYWQHARKYKGSFFLLLFAYSVAALADSTLAPYIYRIIIDRIAEFVTTNGAVFPIMSGPFSQEIMGYIGIIVLVYLADRVLYTIGDFTIARFQLRTIRDLTNYAFSKVINHSYQFFINSFAGSLVKRAGRFVYSFEDIHDILVYHIWLPVMRLIAVYTVLFIVAPPIGWLYLLWSLIFICLSLYFAKRRVPLDIAEAAADTRTTGRTADVFTNALNLKMFASGARERGTFNDVTTTQMEARAKAWRYQNFTYFTQGSIITWLQIMSLFVSVSLWFEGWVSLGTIVLAYSYSGTIFDSVWNIGKQTSRLSRSFSNASEMVDIIDTPIEIVDSAKPEKSRIKEGEINFDKISFSYKQGNRIFADFDLKVKAGEKLGIVGSSGAGKTTITKLLLRFADVTGGAIKIDGQDIRNIKQDDLRASIAYVPQDPILFHRSLSENIAYGKPTATQKEIEEAAKLAHADDFITNLHHGYDTLVGERGVKLSGGERQRVAIARAILKNAPILILDEATSSLDSVSEMHIKAALDVLMKGRTTIVIAHRLSTIEKMDRIIVLEQGKIVEEGTHKSLIDKKGVYHNFWSHQQKGFIK